MAIMTVMVMAAYFQEKLCGLIDWSNWKAPTTPKSRSLPSAFKIPNKTHDSCPHFGKMSAVRQRWCVLLFKLLSVPGLCVCLLACVWETEKERESSKGERRTRRRRCVPQNLRVCVYAGATTGWLSAPYTHRIWNVGLFSLLLARMTRR